MSRLIDTSGCFKKYDPTFRDNALVTGLHYEPRLTHVCSPWAIGRNPAFYLTTSHETAVAFAKERSNAHGAGTQAAVVTVTVHRDKVKVYEFDAVDQWLKVRLRTWY